MLPLSKIGGGGAQADASEDNFFGFLDNDDTFWVMVMMKNEADLAWSIKVD